MRVREDARRGGALLMVLWLSAALSAIAFSVATTVRAEIERTSTEIDGVRAYCLATGALEQTLLHAEWGDGEKNPDGTPKYFDWKRPVNIWNFPTGVAEVETIPESGKVNINGATPEELNRLLLALGVEPERAATITSGIIASRTAGGPPAPFELFSGGEAPTFRPRHASFQEIEELLMVPGVTPDLFYGTYERNAQGRLVKRAGLRQCTTVFGLNDNYDVNTTQPAVLLALGASPEAVATLVEARSKRPVRPAELNDVRGLLGAAGGRVRIGGNVIYTFRSTARLRLPDGKLGDLQRSVAAVVRSCEPSWDVKLQILRWYDYAGGDGTLFDVWPQ